MHFNALQGYTLTPMASVDHDAAARMGAESAQQAAAGEAPHGWTEPEAADYMFLTLLLQALLKVGQPLCLTANNGGHSPAKYEIMSLLRAFPGPRWRIPVVIGSTAALRKTWQ